MCQLRGLEQTGTCDSNSGVATCQPGNVGLVRHLQLFLAVKCKEIGYYLIKLQALPGVLRQASAAADPEHILPLREGLRQALPFTCQHVLCSDTPEVSGSDCSVV